MKETIVLTYPIGSAGSTNYPVLIKLRCRVNTAARIQGKCNEHRVDILISEDLKIQLPSDYPYTYKEIGSCKLRGKNEEVKLLTVSVNDSPLN